MTASGHEGLSPAASAWSGRRNRSAESEGTGGQFFIECGQIRADAQRNGDVESIGRTQREIEPPQKRLGSGDIRGNDLGMFARKYASARAESRSRVNRATSTLASR